jgi:predicted MPP superfamily phosphohydrolase
VRKSYLTEKSFPRDWIRDRAVLRTETSGAFRRVFYTHRIPPGTARPLTAPPGRILFISDLHFSDRNNHSFFPGFCSYDCNGLLLEFLQDTIERFQVKHILFGGDLFVSLCFLEPVLDFFRKLQVPGRKVGVYGNWDLKFPWISYQYMEKRLKEEAGLELLCNRETFLDGIRLYGMDEFRNGASCYTPPADPGHPNWILTHNPDAIPSVMGNSDLAQCDLILCGHTHGGQIRLPLLGAVQTSSVYWKHFEYGLYRHRKSRTKMLVTAGLGTTLIRHRLFCPPEAVILDVQQDPAWNGNSTEA